jgi:serine protease inhibitor
VRSAGFLGRDTMKQMWVERRWLLKGGLGALAGLVCRASLADVLVTDDGALTAGDDSISGAQLRLGEQLMRYLASHKPASVKDGAEAAGHVVVSPASLAAILSLVDLGGSPLMHSATHRTLGFKHAMRRKELQDLASLRSSVSAIIRQNGKDGPMVMANLVAFDRVIKPKQLAMYALSGAGADVLVDTLSDARVIDRINGWVKEKTRDLIPQIIDEAPETLGLVALNALYFRDRWQIPFEPSRTVAAPFQTASGKPVNVPMMHSKVAAFRFRQDDRFIAAELGYANQNFKLVVATTKSAPAQPYEFAAVTNWLNGRGFDAENGEIALPQLKLPASGELLQPLDTMGLFLARHSPRALQGFSDAPLEIARIVQKIELRVNEEGTEGAAATAVMTTRGIAVVRDHIKMVVDKPFVFALRDDKTGLILFMGYVGSLPS